MAGGLLIASNLFAGSGDFIIDGNVGMGTDAPRRKLDVQGSIQIMREDWEGLYFGNLNKGAYIWRQAFDSPEIVSDKLVIGRDGSDVQIIWDTLGDGQWGYCEGVPDNGNPSWQINCSSYAPMMTNNDYYWVWKHGSDSQHPETADLKFVFDGESNDGVMGFMEDEDYFYFNDDVIFNDKVGIGTANPGTDKLKVAGTVSVNSGANIVYRCTTSGALPVGALTINAGNCGASADTGLRVN